MIWFASPIFCSAFNASALSKALRLPTLLLTASITASTSAESSSKRSVLRSCPRAVRNVVRRSGEMGVSSMASAAVPAARSPAIGLNRSGR